MIIEELKKLYITHTGHEPEAIDELPSSGSNRRYFRLKGTPTLIGVSGESVEENRAFLYMAEHFRGKGLPVPEVFIRSEDNIYYLQEDLGDTLLFNAIEKGRKTSVFDEEEKQLLRKTMRLLPAVQFAGADGMDFSYCYPQAEFNSRSILWDLNYFKYCFLKATGMDFQEDRLEDDFQKMADVLLRSSSATFMYRDFQSRNVMIKDGEPWLIDFQGGRKGPVYYDVASFLWQAKANYPDSLRQELLKEYIEALRKYQPVDESYFYAQLRHFVLFRTMQVLGAYGFRGYFEKKPHFIQSVPFAIENLRQLLLAPPLGQKRVLGVDPGYRTGCKLVCLDAQGALLHNEAIYPHPPQNEKSKAAAKVAQLVATYAIDAIAIGNGTASRETEQFITNIRYDRKVQVFVVSENGASIYSASKIARDEFPEYDVTVRGAVSIGRRLMDPLAELVKIDPKSIGVGQYQHDVEQGALKKSLDQTVESCVNLVGVNVNTASKHLLTYISGLGPTLAQNIVDYRTEHGPFQSRRELLKVLRMGEKAFEQSAGFLRIQDGKNPLDNSAVHPESYPIVELMAKDLKCTVTELISNKELKKKLDLKKYVTDKVGMPTLLDIMEELDKPGRDPRQTIQVFSFDPTVKTIEDLKEGQVLPGIVTNITNFGCFVDVGIKENGLVHISELADRFISDPTQVVSIHQHVKVKVLSVDLVRKRVQLSMKGIEETVS